MAPNPIGRVAHVARRGVAPATSSDPAQRRRVTARVASVFNRLDVTGLDEVTASYARTAQARGAIEDLTATGLRTRSALVLRVLEALAERTGSPAWQLALGEVLAGRPDEESRQRACTLLRRVVDTRGAATLGERQQLLYAQLLYLTGEHEALQAALPELERLPIEQVIDLRGDLLNPVHGYREPGTDRGTWWRSFTRAWRVTDLLEPVLAEEDGRSAPDRLEVGADVLDAMRRTLPDRLRDAGHGRLAAQAPTVSVVVTAHRPEEFLATAIRSLAAQTYPHLEILLVDDCSGPQYADTIAAAAALDPRVRVLTTPVNGGAYRARNLGVREATGAVITFHDADDWAHPEKIERQLAALWADPAVVATESLSIRALPDLTRQWLGYPASRVNRSSLMIRRADLLDLGGFDPARKSGDQEFWSRLKVLRAAAPTVVELPLSVVRLRSDSLSRGDFALGWARSARIGHQSAYKRWHYRLARLDDGHAPERVEDLETADALGQRPFAAARTWLDRPTDTVHDVLVVDDVSDARNGGRACAELLHRLVADGYSVALLQREDVARMRRRRRFTCSEVRDLVNAEKVTQVHSEEQVRARMVLVRTPSVLASGQEPPRDLSVESVVVLRPGSTVHAGVRVAWSEAAVSAELSTWTDAPVVWVDAPNPADADVATEIVTAHLTSLPA